MGVIAGSLACLGPLGPKSANLFLPQKCKVSHGRRSRFSSSERQSILFENTQEIPTASVINIKSSINGLHFDETKKQFKWYGNMEELVIYVEDQLALSGTWSVKNNGNLHIFKAVDNAVTELVLLNLNCPSTRAFNRIAG